MSQFTEFINVMMDVKTEKNFFFFFFLVFFFRTAPVAYGSSLARGQNGAAAAGLHHSHSNCGI